MTNFVGLPQQLTAVAMIVGNCQQQLNALAQAYGRSDLQADIPRLTATARNAAKLARDMLDGLLERLPKQRPSKIVEPKPASMPAECPWELTRAAVRKYRNLLGRHATESEAREQLRGMAIFCTTSKAVPKELDNGSIQYRGGRPLRPRLIVKREGDALVLVDVLPDCEAHR
jgi:hypothetical protein